MSSEFCKNLPGGMKGVMVRGESVEYYYYYYYYYYY
jgi:hypothetical protein